MDNKSIKVGDVISGQPPSMFELIIYDHVAFINPESYKLSVRGIDPADYFVTSGDAIEKAKVLEKDIWNLAGELRKQLYQLLEKEYKCAPAKAQTLFRDGVRPSHPKQLKDYEKDLWKAAGQSRKLLNALKKARGDNCFLETEWNNHILTCIPKNPRNR